MRIRHLKSNGVEKQKQQKEKQRGWKLSKPICKVDVVSEHPGAAESVPALVGGGGLRRPALVASSSVPC